MSTISGTFIGILIIFLYCDAESKKTASLKCLRNEFGCLSGEKCIPKREVCDGFQGCRDLSDEKNCPPCPEGYHQCDKGRCLPELIVCDGIPDCLDSSDEKGCAPSPKCLRNQFPCADGEQCIRMHRRCDSLTDVKRDGNCRDGSDEIGCDDYRCPEGYHRCRSGKCVPGMWVCDRYPDCPDGSDEWDCDICKIADCSQICNDYYDEYYCSCQEGFELDAKDKKTCKDIDECQKEGTCDHKCVNTVGSFNCTCNEGYELVDEKSCRLKAPSLNCLRNEFGCLNGERCIPKRQVCDGNPQCRDRSDEKNCPPCTEGYHQCDKGRCVPGLLVCDGTVNCNDESDENRCARKKKCLRNQFPCADKKQCIRKYWRCDGVPSCRDGSDEFRCDDHRCPEGYHRCRSGKCVPGMWVCDGYPDCPTNDDSDEWACGRCKIAGCSQLCKESYRGYQCYCQEGFELDTKDNKTCKDIDECQIEGICHHKCVNTVGSFKCTCDEGYELVDEKSCRVKAPSLNCLRNEFGCLNGERCIPKRRMCDGTPQCSDGSDEKKCPPCLEGYHGCDKGRCVPGLVVCDGIADCNDESDEVGCEPSPKCLENQFPCVDGEKCIRKFFRCDGRYHSCRDGSDEIGCGDHRCPEGYHRCRSGKCVPGLWVCDGRIDCLGGSDESDCDRCKTAGCSQLCNESYRGYKCFCQEGFELDAKDNKTCKDIDECQIEGICHHKCLNTVGSFKCTCDEGYELVDEKSCRLKDRCKSAGCSQLCNETDRGYKCFCQEGFELDAKDNKTCKDIDECQIEGICHHKCVNTVGSFNCTCNEGYELVDKTCRVKAVSSNCLRNQFQCLNGETCLPRREFCDGFPSCKDHSDEKNCPPCPEGHHRCDKGRCVPELLVCDGMNHCKDRSDENGCAKSPKCLRNQFPCADGKECIRKYMRCDEAQGCRDGSDEMGCGDHRCPEGYHRCGSGKCVPGSWICDGRIDCSDASDESECGRCKIAGCSQLCHEDYAGYVCYCQQGFELDAKDNKTCKDIDECQKEGICHHKCVNTVGSFKCTCNEGYEMKHIACRLKELKCLKNEFECLDGERCIPMQWRCNGRYDCFDGSDESECDDYRCPAEYHQCTFEGRTECVPGLLVCDGFKHCTDGSDEKDCDKCGKWGCSHICSETSYRPQCSCHEGYDLDPKDKRTCVEQMSVSCVKNPLFNCVPS